MDSIEVATVSQFTAFAADPVSPANFATDIQKEQKPCLEMNLSCATLIADSEMDVSVSVKDSTEKELVDIEMHVDGSDSGVCFEDTTSSTIVMPYDTVILPDVAASGQSKAIIDSSSELRHGISRYAPYGTRFAARMKDGQFKTSHIAGDLANRPKSKNGKGGRVDLFLVTHEGERMQLDSALSFYELQTIKPGPSEVLNYLKDMNLDWDYRKGEGEKLLQRNASNFFKRMIEHARRIGHHIAQSYSPPPKPTPTIKIVQKRKVAPEIDDNEAAAILEQLLYSKTCMASDSDNITDTEMSNVVYEEASELKELESLASYDAMVNSAITFPSVNISRKRHVDWSLPNHHEGSFFSELCKQIVGTHKEQTEFYSKAAEAFDWESVPNDLPELSSTDTESFETEEFVPVFRKQPKKQKVQRLPKPIVARPASIPRNIIPKAPVQYHEPTPSASVVAENPQPVIRKSKEGASGFLIKGLSRHSPYGTRFCAMMTNGEMRESFLAGDLADRAKGPDGKTQGELILVLHHGEIRQLEVAWEFVKTQDSLQIGAGAVLEYLRSLDLDHNHRKAGTRLLQKNAGNFFKRVQEYGKRKTIDPTYLSLQ